MARRAAFIDSTKAKYPNTLLLDTGNIFEVQEDFQLERGLVLLGMMKKMGYHVIGVGGKDLAWGVKLFQDSTAGAGLLPVSANLLDARTGKLLFKPYAIEQVGGLRVGVFSVASSSPDFMPAALNPKPDSVKFLDPEEAARKIVTELRPKCDVLVGIFNLGNHDADLLAGKLAGVDVALVGGNNPIMMGKGTHTGSALVVSSGTRGQHMARTVVTLEAGKMVSAEAEVFPLGDHWPENEVYANMRKDFEDGLNERLQKRQRDRGAVSSIKHGPDHYMGHEACERCHAEAAATWVKTAHANAFATLQRRRKDSMPDCVPCHVTGFQKSGGYLSSLDPGIEVDGQKRHLENVQCEACHGMATLHDTGDSNYLSQARESCKSCHTPQQDPNFKFDVAWAKIAH